MAIKVISGAVEVTRTTTQTLSPERVSDRKQMLSMELGQLEQEYVQRKAELEKELAEVNDMEAALKAAGVKLVTP